MTQKMKKNKFKFWRFFFSLSKRNSEISVQQLKLTEFVQASLHFQHSDTWESLSSLCCKCLNLDVCFLTLFKNNIFVLFPFIEVRRDNVLNSVLVVQLIIRFFKRYRLLRYLFLRSLISECWQTFPSNIWCKLVFSSRSISTHG